MKKSVIQRLLIALASVLLAAGIGFSAEEGAPENRGTYEGIYDDDFSDDWFYDSYGIGDYQIGEDEVQGYYGEEETGWFSDDEYYKGAYDDEDAGNDWWFDSYDDPGDEGFWDI